ncbi:hypothetical protein AB9K17_23795, partial [Salmonella enterica subsp. enterica serovar Kentucky]|uniref:hypothetical protein n=1 Tax=Salmonella enterica TaxID=28901 RepID=UPI003F4B60F5
NFLIQGINEGDPKTYPFTLNSSTTTIEHTVTDSNPTGDDSSERIIFTLLDGNGYTLADRPGHEADAAV